MGIREIEVARKKLVIHELDDVCDPATGRALTGSWVWHSALVLSQWMATQGRVGFDFSGKTVLELGAGSGLPGLTAALLGADRVVLTDIEPLLPGLRKNVEANGLGDRVAVARIVWGSDEVEEMGGVDLVLMSDVFFDAAEVAALGRTLRKVCGEGTRVWAATELRPWTRECMSELEKVGFVVAEFPSQRDGDADGEFAVFDIVPPKHGQLI
ncbi:Histone-arginine N-methyltransferase [Bertholletia excelsa]